MGWKNTIWVQVPGWLMAVRVWALGRTHGLNWPLSSDALIIRSKIVISSQPISVTRALLNSLLEIAGAPSPVYRQVGGSARNLSCVSFLLLTTSRSALVTVKPATKVSVPRYQPGCIRPTPGGRSPETGTVLLVLNTTKTRISVGKSKKNIGSEWISPF